MIPKDLVAASSSAIVLSILAGGESDGYQIIQSVRAVSKDKLEWADGMLYPVLHRLEARKLVSSCWKTAHTGRKRKYYRLTEEGRKALTEEREQWSVVDSALKKLWAQ
jgi:DNA-binding PadR family transcriptional regulator